MSAQIAEPTYPESLPAHDNAGWAREHDAALTPNYGARRLALVRGEGSRVWDADGKRYLDFLTGISVNNLGHCHPRITEAIREQAGTLVHCSNLYYIPVQIELAKYLTANCFAERVFFGNSGAEANEAAIKLARRWSFENCGGRPERHRVITFRQSFHGRTHATMAATGQEKIRHNFHPTAVGFHYADFNDIESVRAQVTDDTCAIVIEPVQGEGGIRIATREFMVALRDLCSERDIVLIMDEVQSGLGRTGRLFAHEHFGVEPDVMTTAKSLGGGLAMGAMLTTARFATAFGVGAHASTMGGNPLTAAAALAYVRELVEGGWPARAAESGRYIQEALSRELGSNPNVAEIRVIGMMIAIELKQGAPEALLECERAGLLVNVTAGQTIRILPPLNATRDEIDEGVGILARAVRSVSR